MGNRGLRGRLLLRRPDVRATLATKNDGLNLGTYIMLEVVVPGVLSGTFIECLGQRHRVRKAVSQERHQHLPVFRHWR